MIATNTLSIADLQTELAKLIDSGVDPLTPVVCGRERHCNDAYPQTVGIERLRKHGADFFRVEILTS